jgi:glycosyltransferase involved in cell wall biosynthesis
VISYSAQRWDIWQQESFSIFPHRQAANDMGRIKVARIITRLNVGGPAYQATALNHLLTDRGYETLLIHGQIAQGETAFDSLLNEYPGQTMYCKHLQREISPLHDSLALTQLIGILKRFKPDVVHTHTAKAGLLGRMAAQFMGTRAIVHTYHGHVFEGYFGGPQAGMILRAERFLARKTHRLITISERLKTELAEKFQIAPLEKFTILELGLPLERFLYLPERGLFRQKFNISADAILIGTLGRLVPIKNHRRMLMVVAELIRQYPQKNIHLIIGGTGTLENELKQAAADLGLNDRVHFAGLVNDLPAFYADIDLALLTSDNEGTPVTLLEAQAAGKWTIAPNVGGIADILPESNGSLVKSNQVPAYLAVLGPIIETWPAKFMLNSQTRLEIVQRFSLQKLADNIDNLYKILLNKPA